MKTKHVLALSIILGLTACASKQEPAPVSDGITTNQNSNANTSIFDNNINGNTGNTIGGLDTQTGINSNDIAGIAGTNTNDTTGTVGTNPFNNPYNESNVSTPTETVTTQTETYTVQTAQPTQTATPTKKATTQASKSSASGTQQLVGNVNGVYYGNYSAVNKSASKHIVQKGDTVYNISKRYGISQDTLRSLNNLSPDAPIGLGQTLRVKATGESIGNLPSAKSVAPKKSDSSSTSTSADDEGVPRSTYTPTITVTTTTRQYSASEPTSTASRSNVTTNTVSTATTSKNSGIVWQAPANGNITKSFSQSSKGIEISGVYRQPIYSVADGEVVYSGTGLRGYGKLIIVQHTPTYLTAYGNNDALLVQEGAQVKRGQQIATMGTQSNPYLTFEVRENGVPVNPNKFIKF